MRSFTAATLVAAAAAASAGTCCAAAVRGLASCADVPPVASGGLPCVDIPPCSGGAAAAGPAAAGAAVEGAPGVISNFWISTADGFQPTAQRTTAALCYDADAIRVHLNATDVAIFSPWTQCNDAVFVNSDVMEVFMAPVEDHTDAPQSYHEMDSGAAGAMWASCISNPKGNVSYTTCNPETPGTLECSGAATFPYGLTTKVTNGTGWWTVDLTVPWEIFPEKYRPTTADQDHKAEGRDALSEKPAAQAGAPGVAPAAGLTAVWPQWRLNLYRYSFPNGPTAAHELNAWSPTHSPSFHEPHQFGIGAMVQPKATRA